MVGEEQVRSVLGLLGRYESLLTQFAQAPLDGRHALGNELLVSVVECYREPRQSGHFGNSVAHCSCANNRNPACVFDSHSSA